MSHILVKFECTTKDGYMITDFEICQVGSLHGLIDDYFRNSDHIRIKHKVIYSFTLDDLKTLKSLVMSYLIYGYKPKGLQKRLTEEYKNV
jgi:hypothetical protein